MRRPVRQVLTHFRRAIEIDPEYFWPQLYAYFLYTGQKQYEKAAALLQVALTKREQYAPLERLHIDFIQADLAGKRGDAVALMRRARDLAPDYPVMEINLGSAYLVIGRLGDALEAFGRADFRPWLKRNYGVGPFRQVASAHHMLGNYSAELAEAQRGRQHYPDDPFLRYAEARALMALGRQADFTRLVEDSLSLPVDNFPNPGGVLVVHAAELRAHGHREAALAMARRAVAWVRARPDAAGTPALRRALGQALLLADEWDDAHAVFVDLASKDAKDIEVTVTWA